MNFGLGIGYSADSASTPSQHVSSRSATVNALKTGMTAQFRSSFVAASSSSQSSNGNQSSEYANKRPVLSGFVSGGSIGGESYTAKTALSAPLPKSRNTGESFKGSGSQNDLERFAISS